MKTHHELSRLSRRPSYGCPAISSWLHNVQGCPSSDGVGRSPEEAAIKKPRRIRHAWNISQAKVVDLAHQEAAKDFQQEMSSSQHCVFRQFLRSKLGVMDDESSSLDSELLQCSGRWQVKMLLPSKSPS